MAMLALCRTGGLACTPCSHASVPLPCLPVGTPPATCPRPCPPVTLGGRRHALRVGVDAIEKRPRTQKVRGRGGGWQVRSSLRDPFWRRYPVPGVVVAADVLRVHAEQEAVAALGDDGYGGPGILTRRRRPSAGPEGDFEGADVAGVDVARAASCCRSGRGSCCLTVLQACSDLRTSRIRASALPSQGLSRGALRRMRSQPHDRKGSHRGRCVRGVRSRPGKECGRPCS